MKRTDLILRSMMFVPGHNKKLLESASKSNADALILDMEDSVMPQYNKEIARNLTCECINDGMFRNFRVFPRINDIESGYLLKDIQALTIKGVDGFVYPKSLRGSDIHFIDKLLETVEYEKKLEIGTFKIIPLIETASAVYNAQEICMASNRVIALTFGCEDFVADLEGIHDPDGNSLFVPRALIAMAARATGVLPIDTVHINVHNLQELRKNLSLARSLGFEGQLALHPKEIDIIHEYYTPTKNEVDDAIQMIKLYYEAEKDGKGAVVKDNKFIGPPMLRAAKKVIKRKSRIKS